MLSFGSLWLPVVLAAAAAWILSAISWMALPIHKNDYAKIPDEDKALEALRGMGLAAGQYSAPHCEQGKMNDPALQEKLSRGPVATIIVLPPGVPSMGKALGMWLGYLLFACFLTAYIARHSLSAGAPGLEVFRLTSCILLGIHVVSQVPPSIWMGRPWRASVTQMIDGALYSLAGGAIFCWLWP